MVDLSIVIVSWNVRDLLRCCLQSLPDGLKSLSSEVFVVDNASSDGSAPMVRELFPTVILIENTENTGFTRANNQALARSGGRYVLLLNPDTEVTPASLAGMVAYMDATPGVGVVGPQMIYPEGAVQSSRRRFPTLSTLFVESTAVQRLFPRSAMLRRFYMLDKPHDTTQEVDWLVGACLLVRREAMQAAGLLDEQFFMYCEEMDWCLRIKQKGWKVVYLPAARVIHYEARSSEQALPTQHIHFYSSRVAYVRKHFGSVQAQILRLYLLGTYVVQSVEEGAKWLVGHKRPLRARRLTLYRQVISSGLDVSRHQRSAASRP
jgi:N-acetylglucosaminyl-diphospho-decaprenol L-rhamnosyltransferase